MLGFWLCAFLHLWGVLRCDELIKLRCSDIVFNEQGMVVKIVSSKTDQFREGASLVIACTGTTTWHDGKIL